MLLGVSHLWGMARVSGSDDYTGAEQDKLLVFNQGPLGCNKKKQFKLALVKRDFISLHR